MVNLIDLIVHTITDHILWCMKNNIRNKPCLCGSGIKSKKCCWFNLDQIETSKKGIEKFNQFVKEVSEEFNMICVLEKPRKQHMKIMGNEIGYMCFRRRTLEKVSKGIVWELQTMRIRDDQRGSGIGSDWLERIIKLSDHYHCPLMVNPSDIDYEDDVYYQSKRFLNNWDKERETWGSRFGDQDLKLMDYIVEHYKEIHERFEGVDLNTRFHLRELSVLKLTQWYKRFGFELTYQSKVNYNGGNHTINLMTYEGNKYGRSE